MVLVFIITRIVESTAVCQCKYEKVKRKIYTWLQFHLVQCPTGCFYVVGGCAWTTTTFRSVTSNPELEKVWFAHLVPWSRLQYSARINNNHTRTDFVPAHYTKSCKVSQTHFIQEEGMKQGAISIRFPSVIGSDQWGHVVVDSSLKLIIWNMITQNHSQCVYWANVHIMNEW